jgi:hypothetical protein
MGRFLAGVGLATVFAWFFRRRRKPQPAPPAPDPAEELKQKLAESRAEEPAAPAPDPSPDPKPQPTLEERRRAVQERAQAAIDSMREPPPDG